MRVYTSISEDALSHANEGNGTGRNGRRPRPTTTSFSVEEEDAAATAAAAAVVFQEGTVMARLPPESPAGTVVDSFYSFV